MERLLALADGESSAEAILADILAEGIEPTLISSAFHAAVKTGWIAESRLKDAPDRFNGGAIDFVGRARALSSLASLPPTNDPTAVLALGRRALERIFRASVLLVGGGSIAADVLRALWLSGIGQIRLVRCRTPSEEMAVLDAAIQEMNARTTGNFLEIVDLGTPLAFADLHRFAILVCCEPSDDPTVSVELNALSLLERVPSISYRSEGLNAEIGPCVLPGQTACYVCYERRRAAAGGWVERSPFGALPGSFAMAVGADFLLAEILRVVGDLAPPITTNRIWSADLRNGRYALHPVLRLPRCPACGVNRLRPLRPLWEE
jgi:ribosomal protein S12 methylthiotransferase accessory factor